MRGNRRLKPRTYSLTPDTIERLDALARSLSVYPGSLVNLLLARGLDEIERGEWQIDREPVVFRARWGNPDK